MPDPKPATPGPAAARLTPASLPPRSESLEAELAALDAMLPDAPTEPAHPPAAPAANESGKPADGGPGQ